MQGDRPVTAAKVPIIRNPISERNLDKVSGLKLNNLPLEMIKEDVLKFLEQHMELNMEIPNIEMTLSGRNNARVANGMEPRDFMTTILKKFFNIPIYAIPLRDIIPTKTRKENGRG